MEDIKIILLDIEVIPDLKKALKYWTKLSSWPGKTLRASVSSVCVIGWKVFGEKKTHTMSLWDYPEWEKDVNDDAPLLRDFAKIIAEADCVVTHNGKGFDWKHLQTRLILAGEGVLDDGIAHVDTKAISSKKFFFIDNKLQTLAEELFDESKLEHEGWQLWVDTVNRVPKAMRLMAEYCKQDVILLEKVYRKFRALAPQSPNHNIINPYKEKVCPRCGSSRLQSWGRRVTRTKVYKRYRCHDCGATARSDVKDELLR